jgi:hypothetical protein
LEQPTSEGVLQVQVNLGMRITVDGVMQHVGSIHDCLGPTGDTCPELEWVHEFGDCDTFFV